MDVSRPLVQKTQHVVDLPYYLYAPKLFGNNHYSGTTPYKTNEVAFKDHYSPLDRKLDYLDISDRPLNHLPHRRSLHGRLTTGFYY